LNTIIVSDFQVLLVYIVIFMVIMPAVVVRTYWWL